MELIKYFEKNKLGTDYVVGDIHGCFDMLWGELEKIGFNQSIDRLFSVGDLVDRGPDSKEAIEWLKFPWFHAVRGNHEQMAIDFFRNTGEFIMDEDLYRRNGGAWFFNLTHDQKNKFVTAFEAMPFLIEFISTDGSKVGIVHAECLNNSWNDTKAEVLGNSYFIGQTVLWERTKIQYLDSTVVSDVDVVFVGHTPLQEVNILGNTFYIDTGAVFGKKFTIVNASTTEIVN